MTGGRRVLKKGGYLFYLSADDGGDEEVTHPRSVARE